MIFLRLSSGSWVGTGCEPLVFNERALDRKLKFSHEFTHSFYSVINQEPHAWCAYCCHDDKAKYKQNQWECSPSRKLQATFCVDGSYSHILTSLESFPVKQQLSHPTNQPTNIFPDWTKSMPQTDCVVFKANCVSQTNSTPTAQHSMNLRWATSIMRRPDRKWALYRNNWICGLSAEPRTMSLHYKEHINHIQQVKYQRLLSSAGPGGRRMKQLQGRAPPGRKLIHRFLLGPETKYDTHESSNFLLAGRTAAFISFEKNDTGLQVEP